MLEVNPGHRQLKHVGSRGNNQVAAVTDTCWNPTIAAGFPLSSGATSSRDSSGSFQKGGCCNLSFRLTEALHLPTIALDISLGYERGWESSLPPRRQVGPLSYVMPCRDPCTLASSSKLSKSGSWNCPETAVLSIQSTPSLDLVQHGSWSPKAPSKFSKLRLMTGNGWALWTFFSLSFPSFSRRPITCK